jgi:hypothetical protein
MRLLSIVLLFSLAVVHANEPANDIQTKKQSLGNTVRINPQPLLEVIEQHLKMLHNLNIEKAYNDYTATEFRQKVSLDDFKKLVAKYKILSIDNRFQLQSFDVENDIVSLGGELHSKDGTILPVEFDFVMENGKWKIFGIQIYRNELPMH